MSLSSYEKSSIYLSILAIFVSVIAVFKEPLISIIFHNAPKVFVENRLSFSSYVGVLSLNPVVTIANEGASEITLGRLEGEIEFQSGGKIKFEADSFLKNNSRFYLRGITVKPGSAWSEQVNLKEIVSQNSQDEIDRLSRDVTNSIYKNKPKDRARGVAETFEILLPVFEMLSSKSKPPSISELKIKIAELGEIEDARNAPIAAAPELIERAKKIFERNVQRIEKGQHKFTVRLYDRSDKNIWSEAFGFVLHEYEVGQFNRSFDGFGKGVINPYFHDLQLISPESVQVQLRKFVEK